MPYIMYMTIRQDLVFIRHDELSRTFLVGKHNSELGLCVWNAEVHNAWSDYDSSENKTN